MQMGSVAVGEGFEPSESFNSASETGKCVCHDWVTPILFHHPTFY
jgi:hypothetical protein